MKLPVKFTAQEVRNVLSGIDHSSVELDVLGTSDSVYVERDLENKRFEIYGVPETTEHDPLYILDAQDEGEFGFFNRYYMLRNDEFDFGGDDDPTDVPGVG